MVARIARHVVILSLLVVALAVASTEAWSSAASVPVPAVGTLPR